MAKLLSNFIRNQGGVTTIEYALIAGAIFVAIAASVEILGLNVSKPFTTSADKM